MVCYCLFMNNKKSKINFSRIYKRWYVLLIFAFVITSVVHLLCSNKFFEEIELKLTDYRFRLSSQPARADSNVVIVAIDDGSLDYFRHNGISYPWPRSFYRHILDFFKTAGAKAVLFDLQFYEPDLDRDETSAQETDEEFAAAIERNENVCLAAHLYAEKLDVALALDKFSITDIELLSPVPESYKGIRVPIKSLLNSTKALGIITVEPDRDGTIRRVPALYKYGDFYLTQMPLAAMLMDYSDDTIMSYQRKQLIINDNIIPLDGNGNYFPNWYGRNAFKIYPFQAVINSASKVFFGKQSVIPLAEFKDKYVIIGATASGVNDLRSTPIDPKLPGMEIWATILSNFLQQDYVKNTSVWIDFLATLLIIWFVMGIVVGFSSKHSNILLFLLLVLITVLNFFLWDFSRILLNYSENFIGFFLGYLMIITTSYLSEGKARREIRLIFTRYLHPDVVKQLEEEPEKITLGGKEIVATVMYTDIYNFTSLSESKNPKELVDDLNLYFQRLTTIILNKKGMLDKYTGDGIMALFGAPITRKDHALIACDAAYTHSLLRKELQEKISLEPSERLHTLTRIGINSGPLIAGNIGSSQRMDYTAIGDTVNLASRLEGVNKIYKTNIIISEYTYQLVKDSYLCREIDYLRVKGKMKPTRIYELVDKKKSELKPAWILDYEFALSLYRKGEWEKAMDIFEKLTYHPVNDNASQVMLDRCKYLLQNNPQDWNGILTLEVK